MVNDINYTAHTWQLTLFHLSTSGMKIFRRIRLSTNNLENYTRNGRMNKCVLYGKL